MRTPVTITHATRVYRVIFISTDWRAPIDWDDARVDRFLSRAHLLPLGQRDYDARGETPEDAVALARNYLAVDRLLDGTPEATWRVHAVRAY